MIKIAQIGCGYWGPNLLRNFSKMDKVIVQSVSEISEDRQEYIRSNFGNMKVVDDYNVILNDHDIEAVVIATPAKYHYRQAKDVLLSGKHCFVEKPLALKVSEAQELVSIAEKNDKILMVGHTFLYNAAVQKLKELIQNGVVGNVHYIYSQRLNLGRVRTDINALWNFAPHDISIFLYLIDSVPRWVSSIGACYVQENVEDVVFMTMGFENGVVGNIHISWLDPNKVRKMTIVGTKQMIVYDDVSDYKIQIFDKGIDRMNISQSLDAYDDFGKFQLIQRAGDLLIPKVDFVEPLATETKHFIECIINNTPAISDGRNGLSVTRILEAATQSMCKNGARIELGQ